MSTYRLERLFTPRSVAIIADKGSNLELVSKTASNLLKGGFCGNLGLVTANKKLHFKGFEYAHSLASLSFTPDLAIILSCPHSILSYIKQAGVKGVSGIIIVGDILDENRRLEASSLLTHIEILARQYNMRVLGPNSIGLIAPYTNLNASYSASMPQKGDLALISQSGALASGVIEWANHNAVGFSGVASVGDQIDVDFGDLLDFFVLDRHTRAILLYVESIHNARKFMSAARLAARSKPVVVIKSGRHTPHQRIVETLCASLATPDVVHDAAFRRAGLLRVIDLDELFSATETLGRVRPFTGKRLAILTNGGGIAMLTADRLIDFGGTLSSLSAKTIEALTSILPKHWSHTNPIDLGGDADATRYSVALKHILNDRENDGVLVLHVPLGSSSSPEIAKAVIETVTTYRQQRRSSKPVFTVCYGDNGSAAQLFDAARIPNYSNEAEAVRGFTHLVSYREALAQLMETPASLPADFQPDVQAAHQIIHKALDLGRNWLNPLEVKLLFSAYQIPTSPYSIAQNIEGSVDAANHFLQQGHLVSIKPIFIGPLNATDNLKHYINLGTSQAVRDAANDIIQQIPQLCPADCFAGFIIEPLITRPNARELIAGITNDPVFGPVVVFGRGGTEVEVIDDKAIALPPLDLGLANDLISRTRLARRLKAYSHVPAADENAIALVLVKLAQIAADLPEIHEININPLLADHTGVIAIDGCVKVEKNLSIARGSSGHPRFAIRPYPQEWERSTTLADGTPILLRPVKPEDEQMFRTFFSHVTPDDLRLRFFTPIKEFSHTFIARLTQLDYERAMAFVAIDESTGDMLGAVRLHADANYHTGEYGIMTRSDMRRKGIGWLLMSSIIEYARAEGLKAIEGQVLRENTMMLAICKKLGFTLRPDPGDDSVRLVRLDIV